MYECVCVDTKGLRSSKRLHEALNRQGSRIKLYIVKKGGEGDASELEEDISVGGNLHVTLGEFTEAGGEILVL